MIIEHKRYEQVQVYKKKGSSAFLMEVYRDGTRYVVTPLWAGVTTEDLEENWSARLFQRTVPANEPCVQEVTSLDLTGYRSVSWRKTPEPWRELFLKGVQEYSLFELR